jgi:LmbE family N-acetylglucosaminyl deacetylase
MNPSESAIGNPERTMFAEAKNYLRRRLRAAQRGGQYPILLPHHRLAGNTLHGADGSQRNLDPRLAAALNLCDGRHALATISRQTDLPRADLIRAHDDGLLLFWHRPLPPDPPAAPHAPHGVILSPHPDDAALSCGGRMLGDRALLVVNCFTRSAWWRFPFTPADADRIQACRTAEETLVSRLSGCPTQALDLPEALLRGRTMDDVFTTPEDDRDTAASQAVHDAVTRLAHDHPLAHWYLPLGIGNHIDHRLARDAALRALRAHALPPTHLHFYEDLPYAAKQHDANHARAVPGLTLRRDLLPIDDHLPWKLELLRAYGSQFRWSELLPVRTHAKHLGSNDGPAEAVWTPVAP